MFQTNCRKGMATLDFKVRGAEEEILSINLPGCLNDKEVVELLLALQSKVGHHLSAEASAQIDLITGQKSLLPPVVSPAPPAKLKAPGSSKEKRRLAASKQVSSLE